MACPMGYGSSDPDKNLEKYADYPGGFASIDPENPLPKLTLYPPAAEPKILLDIMPETIIATLGGQYAILMQWLKYGLARGSLEHSDFGGRIFTRALNTGRYTTAAVYGTYEEKAAITGLVHKYHARVKGENYFADDPELHRWTAATLYVAFSRVYEMVFKEMPREWHEQLMLECSVFATNLRMPTEMWFTNLDDFWAYWNHNVATLEITEWARQLMRQLLWPKVGWYFWPGSAMLAHFFRTFTIEMLPPRIREGYGLKRSRGGRDLYMVYLLKVRADVRLTPKAVRRGLGPLIRKDMKKAAKRIEEKGKW